MRVIRLIAMMNRLCLDTSEINPFDFELYLDAKREGYRALYHERVRDRQAARKDKEAKEEGGEDSD